MIKNMLVCMAACSMAVVLVACGDDAVTSPQVDGKIAVTPPSGDLSSIPDEPCVEHCLDEYRHDRREERARYRAALRDCAGDSDCKRLEEVLHRIIVREILAQRSECLATCGA